MESCNAIPQTTMARPRPVCPTLTPTSRLSRAAVLIALLWLALGRALGAAGQAAPEMALQLGHTAWVHPVAFSPDGNTLGTCSADGTVKLWDVARGQLLVTLVPFSNPGDEKSSDWMAFTTRGYYAGSPGAGQFIRSNVGGDLYPVSLFRSVYYRPDVVAKILELHDEDQASARPTRNSAERPTWRLSESSGLRSSTRAAGGV